MLWAARAHGSPPPRPVSAGAEVDWDAAAATGGHGAGMMRKELRVRRFSVLLLGWLVVSACGSSAGVKSAVSNKSVQRTEAQVAQQVSKCLPTAGGAPDPLLLRRGSARAKFAACTGVAKHGKAFGVCAIKVILGGLPATARLEKGLTACVEKNA